jgi:hypothetical protein
VLHVATSHQGTPRWIEIQLEHLRRHLKVPYTTWASLPLVDPSFASRFDRIVEQKGPEAGRLNHLAVEIAREAEPQDQLMFLAPNAFPVADPIPLIEDALSRARLLAVRRPENAGDPQPHPSFCVTTVGAWEDLAGDWSDGAPWTAEGGARVTDVGGNLLRRLELTETPWVALERSNPAREDPLAFAIYGEVVYHHGSPEIARVHRLAAPKPLPGAGMPLVGPLLRRADATRTKLWEHSLLRDSVRRSEALYGRIAAGEESWLADVRGGRLARD